MAEDGGRVEESELDKKDGSQEHDANKHREGKIHGVFGMFSVVMYSEENVGVEGNSDPGDTVLVIENHSSLPWLA